MARKKMRAIAREIKQDLSNAEEDSLARGITRLPVRDLPGTPNRRLAYDCLYRRSHLLLNRRPRLGCLPPYVAFAPSRRKRVGLSF
jgi:hypothetical protein